jgi:hypothetical protein
VSCNFSPCGAGEVCCLSDYPGYPNPPDPADFSCESGGAGCEYFLACDGDHDCPVGQLCCATQASGTWRTGCVTSCPVTATSIHVECTRRDHCNVGQTCCGTWNAVARQFRSVLCAPSCSGDRLCASPAECDSGEVCNPLTSLPGFGTCE